MNASWDYDFISDHEGNRGNRGVHYTNTVITINPNAKDVSCQTLAQIVGQLLYSCSSSCVSSRVRFIHARCM
jgi:hypothetical protein